MSKMSQIDIDLQELIATIDTVSAEYDLTDPDSDDGLDGRAILLSRLLSLGWLTPTEREAARESFDMGDGKRLLSLIGGQSVV